jgi:hypothetical protein
VEDLARMELERGECLSPVCNKETREGLSQCIDTTASVCDGSARPYQLATRLRAFMHSCPVTTHPARVPGKVPEHNGNYRVSGVPDERFA